ncbi:MAG TPA: hypothetical protein VG826_33025 [Pirellulales bacterium]|nr:hypothetical protein [Pirellulales bacterium]
MSRKTNNELAFLMACDVLRIVKNFLPPEEHHAAFEKIFETCKRGLAAHEAIADEMRVPVDPAKKLR